MSPEQITPDVSAIRLGRQTSTLRKLLFRILGKLSVPRTGRTPNGSFSAYVTPGAQLSVLNPFRVPIDSEHERFIARWVRSDSIVWDIGANMGLFAFPAALKARNGHVFSFEPDVDLARALLKSVRRSSNSTLPVSIIPVALSDRTGIAKFEIAEFGRSMNKLSGAGAWHDALFAVAETRRVPTMRIDDIANDLPMPDIVKIDVEGAEMMVLEGGRETFARSRPIIFVEGPRELWKDIATYFGRLDYVLFDGSVGFDEPVAEPSWNTVAVPREKVDR